MKYYAGLDVSLTETFVSIVDIDGTIIQEDIIPTEGLLIGSYLKKTGLTFDKIGIESGQLSIFLCKSLCAQGLPIICMDARHAAAALSARINKNDKNDARGLAHLLRTGLYKSVQVKSNESCDQKVLLGSRRQLIQSRQQLVGTVRGLLKIYGIKLGSSQFCSKVRTAINALAECVQSAIEALLGGIEKLESSIDTLNQSVIKLVRTDEDCQRLMTVPGVGFVTAMTYKYALDDPARFQKSRIVGAYFGITPRQYASGSVNRHGGISKMGPKECRTMLYEAAQTLLKRVKASSKLKVWGLKLARKKGNKKAIVAVARKLAVIMHRMLIDKTDFCEQ